MQQPGEHLEHGRFARAVGPEKADELTLLDAEADAVGGADFIVLPFGQPFNGSPQALFLAVGAVNFLEPVGLDGAHGLERVHRGWCHRCTRRTNQL